MREEPSLDLLYRSGGKLRSLVVTDQMAGQPPAVLLIDPKYPHNVGAALRACSCYGIGQLWYTGDRVSLIAPRPDKGMRGAAVGRYRLPREERMRGYRDVTLFQYDRPFDQFAGATPVAVEVRASAENLVDFVHPADALYVFGPEDGSLDRSVLSQCHRFVTIPTKHCLNLAMAVGTVLYDRAAKA